jgi:hypothetical protein
VLDARAAADAGADDQSHDQRHAELFGALEAIVRQRPEAVAAAVTLIKAGDELGVTVLNALGSSGHAEAQHALLRLIEKKQLSAEQLKLAAIALSRSPRPTKKTIAGLVRLFDEPHQSRHQIPVTAGQQKPPRRKPRGLRRLRGKPPDAALCAEAGTAPALFVRAAAGVDRTTETAVWGSRFWGR